ncbi:MAG: hypothetical protein AAF602_26640 [Myxococcota bacterium]
MTKPISSIGLFGIAALSIGCDDPSSVELLVPDEAPVSWAEAYDAPDDGLGALVPVDVMAYDSESGEPLPGVEITVWTDADTAWPVPTEALVVVEPDGCSDCEVWWDAERDEFIEALEHTPQVTHFTDDDGLVRLYLFVDAFPEADGNSGDLAVFVTMGTLEESFVLTPR